MPTILSALTMCPHAPRGTALIVKVKCAASGDSNFSASLVKKTSTDILWCGARRLYYESVAEQQRRVIKNRRVSAASTDSIFHLGDRSTTSNYDCGQFDRSQFRTQPLTIPRASVMIHFTCDRCKRVIDSEQELRYIVRMEIEAVMDPIHDDEPQDDRDHLHEIEEILERMDDCDDETLNDDIYHKRRYDLCPSCFRKFNANPLSPSEKKPQLGFSHN